MTAQSTFDFVDTSVSSYDKNENI